MRFRYAGMRGLYQFGKRMRRGFSRAASGRDDVKPYLDDETRFTTDTKSSTSRLRERR